MGRLLDRLGVVGGGLVALALALVTFALASSLLGAGVQLVLESRALGLAVLLALVAAAWTWWRRGGRGAPGSGSNGSHRQGGSHHRARDDGSHLEGGGTGEENRSGSHPEGGGTPHHLVEELKVPVPLDPFRLAQAGGKHVPPYAPMGEYLVVERWSDGTIRHPTTGVQVIPELWAQDREYALYLLRGGQ